MASTFTRWWNVHDVFFFFFNLLFRSWLNSGGKESEIFTHSNYWVDQQMFALIGGLKMYLVARQRYTNLLSTKSSILLRIASQTPLLYTPSLCLVVTPWIVPQEIQSDRDTRDRVLYEDWVGYTFIHCLECLLSRGSTHLKPIQTGLFFHLLEGGGAVPKPSPPI